MKVNGKEYRIEWFGNQAKVYEYSTDHEGYLFWGNVFAENEEEVAREILIREEGEVSDDY